MADTQNSLFGDEAPVRPGPTNLSVTSQPGRPLTKAQQAFNRLVAKIEKMRAELRDEEKRLDAMLVYDEEHLEPRRSRMLAGRKALVVRLAAFLARGKLKKKDTETLKDVLAEQLTMITAVEKSLTDATLRAIFERVFGTTFEQAQSMEADFTRNAMKEAFDGMGLDIDVSELRPDMSEEELAVMAAKLAAQMKNAEKQRDAEEAERPKSKKQRAKEERLNQVEEARKKSISTIYRQLAMVLHPDLEPDVELKQRKVLLMQELTAAYRNNDLHTLLRLELEWIQNEKADVGRLTDEKLKIFNEVFKEQVEDLDEELSELRMNPRYSRIVTPTGPDTVAILEDGPGEARRLDDQIKSLETTSEHLGGQKAMEVLRELMRTYRAIHSGGPRWS